MIIKPTIGRKVWFWPKKDTQHAVIQGQPHDATIVGVWSDTCVNLACRDANGTPYAITSVLLYQEGGGPRPDFYFAEWMPFQQGQAKRHAEGGKEEHK